MVNNFQDIMASMQAEIDQSLAKFETQKEISAKRFLLEKVASEMLEGIHSQRLNTQRNQNLNRSSS
jgi:hypothetical protein